MNFIDTEKGHSKPIKKWLYFEAFLLFDFEVGDQERIFTLASEIGIQFLG